MVNSVALFDIDGTLVKSIEAHKQAFRATFKKVYDIDACITDITYQGMTDQQILFAVLCEERGLQRHIVEKRLKEWMGMMVSSYKTLVANEDVIVFPGVVNLLEALVERNVALGLVTGNLSGIARIKLEKAGLYYHFNGVGGFGDDPHVKRADLVPLAIKRVGEATQSTLTASQAVLLGDTPPDIHAAKESNVKCIGIGTGGVWSATELSEAGADYAFGNVDSSLEEILKVFDNITNK